MIILLFTESVDIMKHIFIFVIFLVFTGALYSQTANDILNTLVEQNTISQDKADITFKPNAATKVDLGVSYMLPTESFATVKKFGSGKYNLSWVYLSLTFKPQLFAYNFK